MNIKPNVFIGVEDAELFAVKDIHVESGETFYFQPQTLIADF